MAYRVTKEHVWSAAIPDRTGALAEVLRELSTHGLNLELIITRRAQPGRALPFISPLRTLEEIAIAERAGFAETADLHTLRIVGPSRPGLGAVVATALAEAGINLRAVSAAAFGDQQVTSIACDTEDDADRARLAVEEALAH
ncbi:MAG: amino acid-binding protein [Planctomycetes bacterium]|nr:amino acid-binding protein [Planctomycetota bacterium]